MLCKKSIDLVNIVHLENRNWVYRQLPILMDNECPIINPMNPWTMLNQFINFSAYALLSTCIELLRKRFKSFQFNRQLPCQLYVFGHEFF